MSVDIGERIRSLRTARGLSQEEVARRTGIGLKSYGDLERGRTRDPHYSTLRGVARALGVRVEELLEEPVLLGKGEASETGPLQVNRDQRLVALEDEQPTKEPLSPKLRRLAAQARRAELDRVLKHLTLRLETFRDQAKTRYEAGAAPEELRTVFIDSLLLARGAEALLIDSREEAEELGGETAEERRLRGRLEHRIEDVDEARGEISDMWKELLGAKTDAENVMPFLRKRAG
jgi:transcriptional regulator with XRE-family HTH domain